MSDVQLDLQKLGDNVYGATIALISSLFCGPLFIAIYFHHFFSSTDNYRLTAISAAITLPVILVNTIVVGLMYGGRAKIQKEIVGAATVATSSIFIATLLGFFFHLSANAGVLLVLISEIVFLPLFVKIANWVHKKSIVGMHDV